MRYCGHPIILIKKVVNVGELVAEIGRVIVGGYYDYQELRKANMNRIRDIIRRRNEGIPADKPEDKKPDSEKSYGSKYNDKNIGKLLRQMVAEGKLTEAEREYIEKAYDAFMKAKQLEAIYKRLMDSYLRKEPIWWEWLRHIKGISTVLGASLIKHFGYCEKFPRISSLWRYCGLHVVDGKAPRRERGKKIDFNPKMRTLAWKIGDSFIKQRTMPYRMIYDQEKARQLRLIENGAPNAPQNRLHADLRARRKMVKIFLAHYWLVGRRLKGLPLTKPYAHDKLGHNHFIEPPLWDKITEVSKHYVNEQSQFRS